MNKRKKKDEIDERVDWQMTESPAAQVHKGQPNAFERGRHWLFARPEEPEDVETD